MSFKKISSYITLPLIFIFCAFLQTLNANNVIMYATMDSSAIWQGEQIAIKLELVQDKGKIISSIVITLFYLFLWSLGSIIFVSNISLLYTLLVYILAIIRILLCFVSSKNNSVGWDVVKNIPFVLLVFVVGFLFFYYRNVIFSLVYAWVAIYFSLIFSIVIIFLSSKTERVGFWVILRNLSFIWLISMFVNL